MFNQTIINAMTTYYFKCTLLSNVVLNSKLATEGNMTTLDYIPGSNFLGIAANKLYKAEGDETAYKLFHSGEVKFGDGRVATNTGEITYAVPFSFFQDKLKSKLENDPIYLHHLITSKNFPKDDTGTKRQLQQSRSGYISAKGTLVKEVEKRFSLKSAYDREKRTSKTGNMFGFEAIPAGTVFIFSISSENKSLLDKVAAALKGNQRLGKSKTAEYGQVQIEKIEHIEPLPTFQSDEFTLVYAESNLCFFDQSGQPTFQPTTEDLGLDGGIVDWSKSQIRTYSYAPWNGQRKTTSTQRHCIAKGSVFYVKGGYPSSSVNFIGHYQAEGLGKVIYNPIFLKSNGNEKESPFEIHLDKIAEPVYQKGNLNSPLSQFLKKQKDQKAMELLTSELVTDYVYKEVPNRFSKLNDVSPSQWGNIRLIASRARDVDEMKSLLYEGKEAYLKHGVAYEKCWGKNSEQRLKNLKDIISAIESKSQNQSKVDIKVFVAKFAAEMAKENKN
ncbi:hypothetical protein E4S40_10620 [Algoriphagus kandeliae]|uniref:CRISPR-associated protein n=1 Tax=Algoriphagus kandeliae TaxID=2562278 RepID=A0A4Y9QTK0_9BACT|nr:hypothetical protein [Algoriphagus kandeliae]TFV94466.1 hypothetical protein E4S40_10620 [Algoriphagus kandeliae]